MNWLLLVNSSLAFGLLFVVLLTLTFFINYKRDRKNAVKKSAHPTRGRYFVRHLPEALKAKYKVADTVQRNEAQRWEIKKFRLISYIPASAFTLALAFFVFQFGHLLRGPSALTEQELEGLKYTEFKWKVQTPADAPSWGEMQKQLKGRRVVLFHSSGDAEWIHPVSGKAWVKSTLRTWQAWAESERVPFKECDWSRMGECGFSATRDIAVAAPGRWDSAKLDRLMSQGASVLLIGAPVQIFGEHKRFEWNDMIFERQATAQSGPLILAGDQTLTLGLPAGKVLPLAASETGYAVQTPTADAYRLPVEGLFTGQVESALFAGTSGTGRFVWADYSPAADSADELNAAVFRFLLRKPYESWATWPEGKTAAAFISSDVEDDIDELDDLLKSGMNRVGWFLLSSSIERDSGYAGAMAKTGELNCHGDNHDGFEGQSLRKQTQRLALCKKVVRGYQEHAVFGFRPPEEDFDDETLSAAANSGYDYVFVGHKGLQASPKMLQTVGAPGPSLMMFSRMVADDFYMYSKNTLTDYDRRKIVDNDWRWIQRVRGLHTYNFHTQNLKGEKHKELIRYISDSVNVPESFTTSPSEIVEWWRVREQLTMKHKPSPAHLEKFKPVKLSVNAAGKLVRTPMFVERGTASKGK